MTTDIIFYHLDGEGRSVLRPGAITSIHEVNGPYHYRVEHGKDRCFAAKAPPFDQVVALWQAYKRQEAELVAVAYSIGDSVGAIYESIADLSKRLAALENDRVRK